MRAFHRPDADAPRAAVVVGEGLLGRAVTATLSTSGWQETGSRPTDWSARPTHLAADVADVLPAADLDRLDVIWTAGASGMQLDRFDEDGHRQILGDRLQALADFAHDRHATVRLTLASSAGALGPPVAQPGFELQDSAYARMKAAEEAVVASVDEQARILRVASAYGAPRGPSRAGVVGLLLSNALLGRETPLFARLSTMRNYVLAADVATGIVRSLDAAGLPRHLLFAAPRSHAMSEVIAEVRRVVRRAVPVVYRPPANDHDMVFDPAAISSLVPRRPLAAGVRHAYDELVSR